MTTVAETVPGRVTTKITRRLMPFLFVLYITAFIDRVNVGFAGLQMTKELGFSNEVFGFGAGIFFFGYCLLEVPGAIVAEHWSARKWIAAIMIVWGALAALTGLIHNAIEFNIIRFVLGVAEGGFFPAIVVYLTHWYRQADRAKAVAMFMAAIPVSNVFGAPIAGLLLRLNWFGLAGWRWLLILEGIPAFLGGIATLLYLTDRPKDAKWLTPEERDWITAEIERDRAGHKSDHSFRHMFRAFRDPVVLALAFSYFLINTTGYGLNIWLPKIVQRLSGLSTLMLSLIVAIPYLIAVPAMLINGWHSDRTNERRWHAIIPAFTAGISLLISQWSGAGPVLTVAMFTITAMSVMSYYPTFWALTTKLLRERSAAASVGFVNLIANLGGFVGPYAVGFLTDLTGNYAAGIYLLVATALLAGITLVAIRK